MHTQWQECARKTVCAFTDTQKTLKNLLVRTATHTRARNCGLNTRPHTINTERCREKTGIYVQIWIQERAREHVHTYIRNKKNNVNLRIWIKKLKYVKKNPGFVDLLLLFFFFFLLLLHLIFLLLLLFSSSFFFFFFSSSSSSSVGPGG
jgi:hypothetical protein